MNTLLMQQQLLGIKAELMLFASFSFYSLLTMAINRFPKTKDEAYIDFFSLFHLLAILAAYKPSKIGTIWSAFL